MHTPLNSSPIEDKFLYNYAKYASDEVIIKPQYNVTTLCGLFIIDFVLITSDGYRVGIECDGREFHDESRDEWRDAMILGENHVDSIYRLRGSDINYHIEDVLYLILSLEPTLFSERGFKNLNLLSSSEIQNFAKSHAQDIYSVTWEAEESLCAIRIETRRRIIPNGQRRFWNVAYQFAVSVGGGPLDDVINKYRNCTVIQNNLYS